MVMIFIIFAITFTYCFLGNVVSISNGNEIFVRDEIYANSLPYEAIFNFGDSISDTGNAAAFSNKTMPDNSPYGSTYFKHPSGRLSNGRLIIDFIAEAYGLPFLPAYMNVNNSQEDMKKGVNFAFSGASALKKIYFARRGIIEPQTDHSLSVQFEWFKKLKPFMCKSKKECTSYFKKSLFIVGEIGGNDVLQYISSKKFTKIRKVVPYLVESITHTTISLIKEGAVELVIPGNFPIGCNAGVLTNLISTKKEDYDELGCLIAYNAFAEYYNEQLKNSIETLRHKYPQAKIIYFDYYNNLKRLYQTPQQYGFISDKEEILKACCGGSGPYHVNLEIFCGTGSSTVCPDPSKYINWDGSHLTEASYKLIAKGLVEGPFANPSLKTPLFNIA
ncbi:GDSL-like lipase/acylhydrolase [Medicago truncatula]|uniref:GDSL-like lipase/acylhydrolase n=1 Tax=Medicago truncatula TaxID=3880 RepID=A0A072UYT9_MEDTR|nr:GDSL-like lipase/acylhydrolase [Medicago truncatula]KEH34274.1 GDSL-like lipase/acylhydrolase [Medicago truncatula]KEH34275.1 GDSL-like lipase/acylhydrolase [Medicago truncatula]KEH34276.1 GDSL-like lipase/acylhydrolase [Medicago truncatula]